MVIWFCYDGGLPTYCDTEPLDMWQELGIRLRGGMTYNASRYRIVYRDVFSIQREGTVLGEHEHRTGFYELEPRPCPTVTSKKGTDLSLPPF